MNIKDHAGLQPNTKVMPRNKRRHLSTLSNPAFFEHNELSNLDFDVITRKIKQIQFVQESKKRISPNLFHKNSLSFKNNTKPIRLA